VCSLSSPLDPEATAAAARCSSFLQVSADLASRGSTGGASDPAAGEEKASGPRLSAPLARWSWAWACVRDEGAAGHACAWEEEAGGGSHRHQGAPPAKP